MSHVKKNASTTNTHTPPPRFREQEKKINSYDRLVGTVKYDILKCRVALSRSHRGIKKQKIKNKSHTNTEKCVPMVRVMDSRRGQGRQRILVTHKRRSTEWRRNEAKELILISSESIFHYGLDDWKQFLFCSSPNRTHTYTRESSFERKNWIQEWRKGNLIFHA